MKIELSADLAEMVSELLHEHQESVGYDEAYASYCGEVAKKFDDAVEQAKNTELSEKENRLKKRGGKDEV
jgi:hypothetical protein|nr:MAG TPA_asm: hypothetical protein [Caudoviricetes sp.]